jgi:hypothetical protein
VWVPGVTEGTSGSLLISAEGSGQDGQAVAHERWALVEPRHMLSTVTSCEQQGSVRSPRHSPWSPRLYLIFSYVLMTSVGYFVTIDFLGIK